MNKYVQWCVGSEACQTTAAHLKEPYAFQDTLVRNLQSSAARLLILWISDVLGEVQDL